MKYALTALVAASLIIVSCGTQNKTVTETKTTTTTTETSQKVETKISSTTTPTERTKKEMLLSQITKENLMDKPYGDWFTPTYRDYSVSAETLAGIKKHINDYKITVFMGTWCSDSKRETPKLIKLLEKANYDMSKLKIIAVDRKKSTPKNLQEGFDIIKVPTIIFSKKGKEVNRFVEYARETLAEDILKIVSNQPYKHSYAD